MVSREQEWGKRRRGSRFTCVCLNMLFHHISPVERLLTMLNQGAGSREGAANRWGREQGAGMEQRAERKQTYRCVSQYVFSRHPSGRMSSHNEGMRRGALLCEVSCAQSTIQYMYNAWGADLWESNTIQYMRCRPLREQYFRLFQFFSLFLIPGRVGIWVICEKKNKVLERLNVFARTTKSFFQCVCFFLVHNTFMKTKPGWKWTTCLLVL